MVLGQRYQLCGCDQVKVLIAHAKLTDGGSLEARRIFGVFIGRLESFRVSNDPYRFYKIVLPPFQIISHSKNLGESNFSKFD